MSLLLLLNAAAASGGDGDQQLNADGAYILDADGNLYLKCCCSACPFCDVSPTEYDVEFTGVNDCPGDFVAPADHTFTCPGPALSPTSGPVTLCSWGVTLTSGGNTSSAAVGMRSAGASIGLGETATSLPFYRDTTIVYGPDCSATILSANEFTVIGDCITHGGTSLGYGGTAVAVPVMPP